MSVTIGQLRAVLATVPESRDDLPAMVAEQFRPIIGEDRVITCVHMVKDIELDGQGLTLIEGEEIDC